MTLWLSGGGPAAGTGRFTDGTVSLPSISFAADPDTGFYRIGANNIGVAVNGAKVLDIGATYLGIGASGLATTGSIRLPTATGIYWRNNAGDANIGIVKNSGDAFAMGANIVIESGSAGGLYTVNDNGSDLGGPSNRLRRVYTAGIRSVGLPTSDPAVAGEMYSMNSAGLAAELAAGSRYVLISDGP